MMDSRLVRAGFTAALAFLSGMPLIPSLSLAQPSGPWSLERVEQTALETSPQIRNAVAAVEAAKSYRAFGTIPVIGNPVVGIRAMVGKPDAPAATYSALFGIPFDVSGKRRAWRSETSAIIAEAEANLAVARNDVLARAREAYVLVATGEAAQKVADESANNALDVLKRIQARFDAKAATLLDLALAEREYGEAKADTARARREVVEAVGDFRQVLDLPATEPVAVAPLEAPAVPAGLSLDSAVSTAVSRRREMLAIDNAIQRYRRSDKRLRREAVAPVILGAEGEAQGNQNTQSTAGASITTELPIFQRNQGERAVAKGQAAALTVNRELTEHTVAREASVAFQRLEAALAELTALEQQATSAADKALAMTTEMLEAGAVDYFYLLTARRSAFQLRARKVSSLRDAWLSRIALERAVGGLEEAP
jgi:outer membrane protein TolC